MKLVFFLVEQYHKHGANVDDLVHAKMDAFANVTPDSIESREVLKLFLSKQTEMVGITV